MIEQVLPTRITKKIEFKDCLILKVKKINTEMVIRFMKDLNKNFNLEEDLAYLKKTNMCILDETEEFAKSNKTTLNNEYEKHDLRFLKRIKTFDSVYNLIYLFFEEVNKIKIKVK